MVWRLTSYSSVRLSSPGNPVANSPASIRRRRSAQTCAHSGRGSARSGAGDENVTWFREDAHFAGAELAALDDLEPVAGLKGPDRPVIPQGDRARGRATQGGSAGTERTVPRARGETGPRWPVPAGRPMMVG